MIYSKTIPELNLFLTKVGVGVCYEKTFIVLLTFITVFITPKAFALNRALSLDGDGDYEDGFTSVNHVEISDNESLNAINSQVTMEVWIKATKFTKGRRCSYD